MVTRTKKIFVGGLSANTVVEDVKQYFEQFGKVRQFFLITAHGVVTTAQALAISPLAVHGPVQLTALYTTLEFRALREVSSTGFAFLCTVGQINICVDRQTAEDVEVASRSAPRLVNNMHFTYRANKQ